MYNVTMETEKSFCLRKETIACFITNKNQTCSPVVLNTVGKIHMAISLLTSSSHEHSTPKAMLFLQFFLGSLQAGPLHT